jgi:hypothetical protein
MPSIVVSSRRSRSSTILLTRSSEASGRKCRTVSGVRRPCDHGTSTLSSTAWSRQKSRQISSTTAVESTRVPSMSNSAAEAVRSRVGMATSV